jgi:hypothetical protein
MTPEEAAPAFESWPEHLSALGNEELTALAGDYCWLTERNKPEDQRAEFEKRRNAIIAECERRGIPQAADNCRPSSGAIEEE